MTRFPSSDRGVPGAGAALVPGRAFRSVRALASAALVLIPAVGCDGGTGPGGMDAGTGSVQVTGGVTQSFTGTAVAGGDDLTGGPRYALGIASAAGNTADVVFDQGRPGPGTYTIGSTDTDVYGELGIGLGFYQSISGDVTITSSSPQAIAGTATFTALELDDPVQVSVTMSFNAVCTAVPGLFTCN